MIGDVTLGALLQRCPYRSIIGAFGSDLERRPSAVIAAPEPGLGDPAAELIDEALQILRAGGSVLVITADPADRLRIRSLLGAVRVPQWGTA